jgi:hypothetical protein
VIRVNGGNRQFDREPGDLQASAAMTDDQPSTLIPQPSIQFDDRLPDELDTAVGATFQRIEDLGIEDEDTIDAGMRPDGLIESGMIVITQIAAEPN